MLSDKRAQDAYREDVPHVDIAPELISSWFDDTFFPEDEEYRQFFESREWGLLMDFHRFFSDRLNRLPMDYESLKSCEEWDQIVHEASRVLKVLGWGTA